MPNTSAAKKDLRQNIARREHNRQVRSAYRTAMRRVRAAVEAGDVEGATKRLSEATSKLDKAAKRHILHPKTASRYQSRLALRIKAIPKA